MEAQRTYVLDAIARHERIPFSPIPESMTATRASTRRPDRKRTAKLNPERVRDIRQSLAAGVPIKDIATRYGVTVTAIGHIRIGRSWSDVV